MRRNSAPAKRLRVLPPGRALLRLKPSRRCESMGHTLRYAVLYRELNALRARWLGGDVGVEPPLLNKNSWLYELK